MASTINNVVEKTGRSLGFKDFLSSAYKFVGFSVLAALPYIITNLDSVGERLHYNGIWSFLWSLITGLFFSVLDGIVIAASTLWYSILHAPQLISEVRIGTIIYVLIVGTALVFTIYQPVKIIGKLIETTFNPFLACSIALLITIGFAAVAYYASDGSTISSGLKGQTTVSPQNETLPTTDTTSYAPSAALDLNEAGG